MGQQLNEFEVLITFGKTGKEIISVKLYETFGDVHSDQKLNAVDIMNNL